MLNSSKITQTDTSRILYIYIYIYVFLFCPHLWHMEVLRPRIKSQLQLWPIPRLQECCVLNPLHWAGDRTHVLAVTQAITEILYPKHTVPQRELQEYNIWPNTWAAHSPAKLTHKINHHRMRGTLRLICWFKTTITKNSSPVYYFSGSLWTVCSKKS